MKIRYSIGLMMGVGLLVTGCQQQPNASASETSPTENVREYSIQSVLWQQNAAEYRALCYQAYNLAKTRLTQLVAQADTADNKLAVITDIDETVLDNSPFNAKLIALNEQYSAEEWANWVKREDAKAVPGAVDFLNFVKTKGVEVFYVSNRPKTLEKATIENLKKLNLPYANSDHLLLKAETSAKKSRFEEVRNTHKVLLYIGDNLGDFSSQFRMPSTKKRNALAKQLEAEFGNKFIVLPNPMYGDWESKGIYEGRYDWTEAERDSIRHAKLNAY